MFEQSNNYMLTTETPPKTRTETSKLKSRCRSDMDNTEAIYIITLLYSYKVR